MSKTVWKYLIPVVDELVSVPVTVGSKLLLVARQGAEVCVWFEVERDAETKLRWFRVFGTGQTVAEGAAHVGSVVVDPFVWHVYEVEGGV